jgi:hypothetical protein
MKTSAQAFISLLGNLEREGFLGSRDSQEQVLTAVARASMLLTLERSDASKTMSRTADMAIEFVNSPENESILSQAKNILGEEAFGKITAQYKTLLEGILQTSGQEDLGNVMIRNIIPIQILMVDLMKENNLSEDDAVTVYQAIPLAMNREADLLMTQEPNPLGDISSQFSPDSILNVLKNSLSQAA